MDNLVQMGIVGGGFVGKATSFLGRSERVKTFIYDKNPDKSVPLGISLRELSVCRPIFVCVPTPMNEDGSCDVSIVNSVVEELRSYGVSSNDIIVRSTVPVGTCKLLGVNFMPEFLTEANWEDDVVNNKDWVFGINTIAYEKAPDEETEESIKRFVGLIEASYDDGVIKSKDIHIMSSESAELVKLARNSFLAMKVGFFNELREFCKKKEVNFNTVAHCVGLDERIGLSHSKVPGPDGKRGYGGTCLPKDIKSLLNQMDKIYMKSYILNSVVKRNDEVDRTEYFDEFPDLF